MHAYRIERFGSVDGIELRSSDDPRPGLREVLTRVRASSLNYRDLMVLKGGGRGPVKIRVIPVSDDAGEVAAVGDGGPVWVARCSLVPYERTLYRL
jgi:NADPH:quinone reductase-like Zn-dependent oxidoreductase